MVNNEVGHDIYRFAKLFDVLPIAQALIDQGMIDRIETRVFTIVRVVKRKDVNTRKQAT